eukprot:COSAG02_NODE_21846_length_773_cov_0.767062_2_plen_47_part_01
MPPLGQQCLSKTQTILFGAFATVDGTQQALERFLEIRNGLERRCCIY